MTVRPIGQSAGEQTTPHPTRAADGESGPQAVYGEPVERDGVTIIPIARVRSKRGATAAAPAGYIEISNGRVAFHPIRHPATVLLPAAAVILAGGIAASMVLSVLRHTAAGAGHHEYRYGRHRFRRRPARGLRSDS
jgi:hypothetical protein